MSDTNQSGVSSHTSGVNTSLTVAQAGIGAEQQAIAELMARYPDQDPIAAIREELDGDYRRPATASIETKSTQTKTEPLAAEQSDNTESDGDDEFVNIFRKKKTEQSEDGASSLPDRISVDELAEQYGTTPDKILQALTVKTKVHDEEADLPLHEVIKGYQTEKVFTQKMQALAEKERSLVGLEQNYNQKFQAITDELNKNYEIGNALKAQVDKEMQSIDWTRLQEEDPIRFLTLQREYDQKQQHFNNYIHQINAQAQNQKTRMEQEQQHSQAAYAQQFQTYVHEQKRLLIQKRPELADEKNFKVATKELKGALQNEVGLTEEQLLNPVFSDHRFVDLLIDAYLYRRMSKGDLKSKLVAKPVMKTARAQARQSQDVESAEVSRLEQEFETKKDVKSAINALLAKGIRL